jgi:NAD(P)-dependent dehydrogenase (short-subunit alcohol dehydrogenase family)
MAKGTAIVTGSSRGIGRAIALRLAQDGFSLVINDISANQAGIDATVKEITSAGGTAIGHAADVTIRSEVEALVKKSVKELGELTVMVANAGIAQVKPMLDLTEAEVNTMFAVNFNGVFNCYTLAAKQMLEQGKGGKIIGCASIVAFKPFPLLSHYSATKWAVRGLTQSFAMEMGAMCKGPEKITVNGYAPGIVGTAMWDVCTALPVRECGVVLLTEWQLIDEKLGEIEGRPKGESIKKYVDDLTALKRTSVPEDVAKVVSFLSGPDSDFITVYIDYCPVRDQGLDLANADWRCRAKR